MAKSSPQPVSYLVQPPLWPDLVALALQARATTNAPGAAIALISESAGEIVCYARSGSMAPELGTASLVDDSLTAQCVRSGKQLQCHDTGIDTRVCSAAAAELAARSLVVTPIQQGSQVIGVLAVFSNTADAFSPIHLVKLQTIADQVTVVLHAQQDQQGTMAGQGPLQLLKKASDAPQPDTSRPKPPQPAQLPLLGKEAKREPLPPVQIVPVSGYSSEQLPAIPVAVTHRFATLNAVAGQKKESAITHRILAVAVGLLVVAGSATWASWKRAEPSRVDATSIQGAQQVTPPAEMPPQSAEPASQKDASTQPLKTTEQQPSSDAAVGVLRKTDLPRKRTEAARGNATPEERSVAGSARSVDTVDLASHKDPPLLSATKEPASLAGAADVAPPAPISNAPQPLQSVPVVANDAPPVSAPPEPAAASKQTPPLKSDVVPARLVRRVPPQYPAFALQMRTSGMVVVHARVAKNGHVADPKFLSGPAVFRNAALDAVKLWQYAPATLNGQPIEQDVDIKLEFLPNTR